MQPNPFWAALRHGARHHIARNASERVRNASNRVQAQPGVGRMKELRVQHKKSEAESVGVKRVWSVNGWSSGPRTAPADSQADSAFSTSGPTGRFFQR